MAAMNKAKVTIKNQRLGRLVADSFERGLKGDGVVLWSKNIEV
jgi:hypothetical protein